MVSGKGALTGAAAGAAVGSIVPLVGTGVGAALGGLGGLFMGGNKKDDKLEDLRTPQQIEAAKILQQLGTTGSGGGINLGEAYGGSLGSFDPTQFEQQGLSQLFGQQPNAALSQAEDVFGKLSGAAFDPNQLEPFRKAAVRSEGQALDRLSQSKAATGSRFGTGFGRDASSLIEGTELGIQQQLANLFLGQQQVSAQGAAGLAGVGGTQANIADKQLGNLFNFGALERQLKNQEAQAEFNEFNRQRGETLGRVDLLSQEANRNPLLGVSSLPGGTTGFQDLINSVLGGVGTGIGESIGKDGLGKLSGIFDMGGGGTSVFGNKYGTNTPEGVWDTGRTSRLPKRSS